MESNCQTKTGTKSAIADATVQRTVAHLVIAHLVIAYFMFAHLLSFICMKIPLKYYN
ncbi:MAG: hypothetical protein LBK82_02755 [Planctomycetaceae bacterium]|nr:hypothetical protein [Planctomycetaceae bacterium]